MPEEHDRLLPVILLRLGFLHLRDFGGLARQAITKVAVAIVKHIAVILHFRQSFLFPNW